MAEPQPVGVKLRQGGQAHRQDDEREENRESSELHLRASYTELARRALAERLARCRYSQRVCLERETDQPLKPFRVSQIDHVEVFVPDRYEAAEWYKRTLGLDIVPGYEQWAANPRGPLMISSDDGSTKLALFEGQPQESGPMSGWHLVAFRVDGDGFLEFVTRLADRPLIDRSGTAGHRRFGRRPREGVFGVFFRPYGHRLELTTYDYEATRAALTQLRSRGR